MPKIFPNGTQYVQEKTGWVFQGHNRYWAPDNVYATQNGGEYPFIVEPGYAIPGRVACWGGVLGWSGRVEC